MANIVAKANTGTGTDALVTDQIAGAYLPKCKIMFGVDGAGTDVTASVGFPTSLVGVGINDSTSAASETATDRLKVNAGLRLLDTSQASGSQLVAAKGDQALGLWVNVKNTVPVTLASTTITGSVAVTGPLTDAQLRATAVPVSGTFWQATQPVSGPLTDTQLRATAVPVSLASTTITGTVTTAATKSGTWALDTAAKGLTFAGSPTSENTDANTQSLHAKITNTSIPVTGTFWQTTQPVSLTSTTITGTVACTQSGTWNVGTITTLPALATGANVIGKVGIDQTTSGTTNAVVPIPSAAAGASTFHHLIAAATTNATSVKASAGTINCMVLTNPSGTMNYLKLYNKASAPVVGTDIPVMTIGINTATTVVVDGGPHGIRFPLGIAYAITGVITDADTTAVGLSALAVNINYT